MDILKITGKTIDELDILESKLASASDAITEAQVVIRQIREARSQPNLPIRETPSEKQNNNGQTKH